MAPSLFLDIVSQSYTIVPPDKLFNTQFYAQQRNIFNNNRRFWKCHDSRTQLAAPALIMILMTDSFWALPTVLAPQVQITFLGMPLNLCLLL